jgi:hypothetical protein
MTNDPEPDKILARIDREIELLLKHGRLSELDYGIAFPVEANTNRKANLKALLEVRRRLQELK